MKQYIIQDVWEPDNNQAWSFTDDKGNTVTLITYYLTLSEKDGPEGIRARMHQKPDTNKPVKGEVITGDLVEKTSKAGKDYLQFKKKSELPPLKCPDCGKEGPLQDFKQSSQTPLQRPQSDSKTFSGQSGVQVPPKDDEPPLENYDDIPFN